MTTTTNLIYPLNDNLYPYIYSIIHTHLKGTEERTGHQKVSCLLLFLLHDSVLCNERPGPATLSFDDDKKYLAVSKCESAKSKWKRLHAQSSSNGSTLYLQQDGCHHRDVIGKSIKARHKRKRTVCPMSYSAAAQKIHPTIDSCWQLALIKVDIYKEGRRRPGTTGHRTKDLLYNTLIKLCLQQEGNETKTRIGQQENGKE